MTRKSICNTRSHFPFYLIILLSFTDYVVDHVVDDDDDDEDGENRNGKNNNNNNNNFALRLS